MIVMMKIVMNLDFRDFYFMMSVVVGCFDDFWTDFFRYNIYFVMKMIVGCIVDFWNEFFWYDLCCVVVLKNVDGIDNIYICFV